MNLRSAVALALLSAGPAFAATTFVVDFEKTWDYAPNADVNGYYNGGTASDGSSGPNLGVAFAGISGFSNDGVSVGYSNAPSMQGVAYAFDATASFMNVAAGVVDTLSFYVASLDSVTGAVKAYTGLNGTGSLLGSYDVAANSSNGIDFDTWALAKFTFGGTAQSFDFTGIAGKGVAIDNITAVPEPSTYALLLAGLTVVAGVSRVRRRS